MGDIGHHFEEEPISDDMGLSFRGLDAVKNRRNMADPKASEFLLTEDGRFTNLALILSDQCPWRIQIWKDDRMLAEIGGPAFDQIPNTCTEIRHLRMRIAEEAGTGPGRIHELALMEGLLNAVMHRDYGCDDPITVRLDPCSITIVSPGGLYFTGFSQRDRTRNPRLKQFLYELGSRNNMVMGLPGVVNSYKSCRHQPVMIFRERDTMLYLPVMDEAGSAYEGRRYRILRLMSACGGLSLDDISEMLGIQEIMVLQAMKRMEADETICMMVCDKDRRYFLNDRAKYRRIMVADDFPFPPDMPWCVEIVDGRFELARFLRSRRRDGDWHIIQSHRLVIRSPSDGQG